MSNDDVTKSNDPKLIASRVFIGNLPSERTSRDELEEKFIQYGPVLGISIHQGFAFVQYGDEKEATAAVEGEQGCYFKGKRLDLRVASEGRKRPVKRAHEDFPNRHAEQEDMNFYPRDGRGPPFMGKGGPSPWENEGYAPESYQEWEKPMEPSFPRQMREDPWRERFPGPPVPPVCPPVEPFRRETYAAPMNRVEYGMERTFDCVIVVVHKHLKMYAELIERKLLELNMTVDVIFLVHENALLKAIDDMTRRGVLYILVVQPQHEERSSITVNIMHGTPQEHRNMPLDDAISMLSRNFKAYLSGLRSGSEQPPMGFLLNLLADGKHLSIADLDRIIAHLQDRRDRMIEAEGGKVVAREILNSVSTNSAAEQLQQRLLTILSGSGGNAAAPLPAGMHAMQPPLNPNLLLAMQQITMTLGGSAGGATPNPAPPVDKLTAPPPPAEPMSKQPPPPPGGAPFMDQKNFENMMKTMTPQPARPPASSGSFSSGGADSANMVPMVVNSSGPEPPNAAMYSGAGMGHSMAVPPVPVTRIPGHGY